MKPLAVDLFCGLGGWAEGLIDAGYRVIGYDIEKHDYGTGTYPGELRLQDVCTLDGAQFRDAALIVASPPCQFFSYTGMPFSRSKRLARRTRGSWKLKNEKLELFRACFRIQLEASAAAGCVIPLVIENVCKAQAWVGIAKGHYGSYYLWGDVPSVLPATRIKSFKDRGNWFAPRERKNGTFEPISRGKGKRIVPILSSKCGTKCSGSWWPIAGGRKIRAWRDPRPGGHSARNVSAIIAKIPYPLARFIGDYYRPGKQALSRAA